VKRHRWVSTHGVGVGRLVATGAALGVMAVSGWSAVPASATQRNLTISTMKTAKNGTVLVGGRTTVYTLRPSSTPCTSACLKVWPAVMLARGQKEPIAGHGVKESELGAVKVKGGRQATYDGRRLYLYIGDKKPGQVTGNFTDTWGKWAAVVTAKPSGSSSGSSGSGSGGSNAGSGGASF
jgi:predicted lipoprotein with Yx(FWY)xxD motif